MDIEKEILETEAKLKELKAKRAEEVHQTPKQKIATILHQIFCRSSHEDQCGWYIEEEFCKQNGEDPWQRIVHKGWLKKAQVFVNLIKNNTYQTYVVIDVLKALTEI
jgi:hypothetical protein